MKMIIKRIINFIIENFVDSVYCVGYRKCSDSFWEEDISTFQVLKPSIRYWYADPIPYMIKGVVYVFLEKYDRFKSIGYIGISYVKKNGKLSKPKTIIKNKYHMSFPTIIKYKNEYYMFPETSATGNIEIYKMNESPYKWKPYYSIVRNKKIVDISVKIEKDSLLLLAGIVEENNPLYIKRQIIQIDNLDNINKISYRIGYTDKAASLKVRNAGGIYEGYCFTQESTEKEYGMFLIRNKINKFCFNEISEMYCEKKTVANIKVNLNRLFYRKIGTHTYGKCYPDFEVIDLALTKFSLLPFIRKRRKRVG